MICCRVGWGSDVCVSVTSKMAKDVFNMSGAKMMIRVTMKMWLTRVMIVRMTLNGCIDVKIDSDGVQNDSTDVHNDSDEA